MNTKNESEAANGVGRVPMDDERANGRPAHARSERLVGLDAARALAVFGMVLVNFEVALAADAEPAWLATATGLVQGRASALFVVLAGFGIQLMANAHGDLGRTRRVVLRRAVFLLVIGYAFLPLWPADILHYYAFYFALGAWALRWRARGLLIGAGVAALGFCVLGLPVYERGWDFESLEYAGLWTLEGALTNLFLNGFHPLLPWSAFLLWGMWLARRVAAGALRGWRPIALAVGVAVAVELASRAAVAAAGATGAGPELADLLSTASMPPMPWYLLAAGATATAVLLGCVHLVDRAHAVQRVVVRPLAHTGQLALTLYALHVLVGIGAFHETGADLTLVEVVVWWVVFCFMAVLGATAWRRRSSTGPLEWILRRAGRGVH